MKKGKISLMLFVLSAVIVLYWAIAGASLWTMTKIPVEVKDELFGTTSTEWHSGFRPGLELVGPIVVVLVGVGIYLRRKRIPKVAQV